MSRVHARAIRGGSQPGSVGFEEYPCPGSDGTTTSNASVALAPCPVGSVSGSMILSCSMNEPGQPWVTIKGRASGCLERTWTKWMSRPSISVTNCGNALIRASAADQSWWLSQWSASAFTVDSCTPWVVSPTVSSSGQRVAATRRCRSSIAPSGVSTRNGRIDSGTIAPPARGVGSVIDMGVLLATLVRRWHRVA